MILVHSTSKGLQSLLNIQTNRLSSFPTDTLFSCLKIKLFRGRGKSLQFKCSKLSLAWGNHNVLEGILLPFTMVCFYKKWPTYENLKLSHRFAEPLSIFRVRRKLDSHPYFFQKKKKIEHNWLLDGFLIFCKQPASWEDIVVGHHMFMIFGDCCHKEEIRPDMQFFSLEITDSYGV